MATVTITQNQTPLFLAAIKSDGDWFDPANLATAAQLSAEGITRPPISYTIYRSTDSLSPLSFSTSNAVVVTGFENVEISAAAILDPEDVEGDYNFQFAPASRTVFPFSETGYYFVDFLLYPQAGAAIAWRVGVEVK